MFGSGRTVLVLSDEAVSVYTVTGGRYDLVAEVPWNEPEFIGDLADLIKKQGRGHPVMILYDMVEQYYRKEIVPKVALLDQQNILKRRLQAAFPNYPIRSSLVLKAAQGKNKKFETEKTQLGFEGKPYLFAALPDTDQIARVTEAIRESMATPVGIFLLPVESVSMVQKLSEKLNKGLGGEGTDRWSVFLAQHRGGGLRQIVVRNGELALTRLTPVVDTDIDPEMWASEVAQEYTATMGYLSRFGYTAASELEVIAVASAAAASALEGKITAPSFFGLNVAEATRLLKLNSGVDETSRYGDILHVYWAAKKLKFLLPFSSKELSFLTKVRVAGLAAMTVVTLGALGGLGYTGYLGWNLYESIRNLEVKQRQLVQLENEYQAELKRKEEFNIDVKLVQGSIGVYDELEKKKIDIVGFLQRIAPAMTPDLRFDDIDMGYEVEENKSPDQMSAQVEQKKYFRTKLHLSFPPNLLPEQGNKIVSDLRDRIAKGLTEYEVQVTKSVQDLTISSSYDYETGLLVDPNAKTAQPGVAEITIRQKRDDQNTGP